MSAQGITDNAVTMVSWVDWMLGLDRVDWSQGQVLLAWRYPLPAWGWVLILLAAVGLVGWGYSGMLGRWRAKTVLVVIRTGLVLLLAALLAGPMLVLKREDTEPDWLLMLVDRSASMQIQDATIRINDQVKTVTRQAALHHAIAGQADLFGPNKLGRNRRLFWLGFDAQSYPIDPPYLDPNALGVADGRITLLRTAIQQALQRASGRPVSGIVLFTDGQSPQSTGAELVRQLGQQAVSVFPVPVGAAVSVVDLSLARVDAPARAFINDAVPVTVWIDRYPADARVDTERVRVRLIDTQTDKTLDQKWLGQSGHPLRLRGRSNVVGPVTWKVQLDYDTVPTDGQKVGSDAIQRELLTDNNQRQVHLELVDRPIRVLYIEGYPRWEYRYLKNVLIREKSILSSMMLISADQDFVQEGDIPITRLPQHSEELDLFDVVIIGDMPADYLSLEQQSLLRDHVAKSGAGLLWIGGAYHTPYHYGTTPLADLLPMRRPGLTRPSDSPGSIIVTPTELAESLSVITLQDVALRGQETDRPDTRWPTDLPGLRWAQTLGSLKPSVDVLATGSVRRSGSSQPLVVRMRYGAGQILYVATDDTWRWRYGRGEVYFQQFWVQLIRMLGRQRVQDDTRHVWLSVSHRRVELAQVVVVKLHIAETILLEHRLPRVSVSVSRSTDTKSAPQRLERFELLPDPQPSTVVSPRKSARGHRVYQAVWQPHYTGRLILKVDEPVLKDLDITSLIHVLAPDDERRQPMVDHERLKTLAQLSGGKIIPLDRMDQLTTLIPNRTRRNANDIRQPLWDAPVTLLVVMVLLTAEWIGRKVIQLA